MGKEGGHAKLLARIPQSVPRLSYYTHCIGMFFFAVGILLVFVVTIFNLHQLLL